MEKKKEVTLLNLGPSRVHCPCETEELWGVSRIILDEDFKDKKFTKIFSMDGMNQAYNDNPSILVVKQKLAVEKAKSLDIPVVSLQRWATERYPMKEIVGRFRTSYFGPTVTYMIAYALYLGYEKLHIYGIDQGPELAYQSGKSCVTFWLGYAIGLGVEIVLGKGSLRWTYNPGLDNFPIAWVREEYEKIYQRYVREEEEYRNEHPSS